MSRRLLIASRLTPRHFAKCLDLIGRRAGKKWYNTHQDADRWRRETASSFRGRNAGPTDAAPVGSKVRVVSQLVCPWQRRPRFRGSR